MQRSGNPGPDSPADRPRLCASHQAGQRNPAEGRKCIRPTRSSRATRASCSSTAPWWRSARSISRCATQEILCVVGPSGCGKTTFLRCIAGLTEITGGELTVGGKPVDGPARRRRDGVPAFRPAAVEDRVRQRGLRPRDGARAGRAHQGARRALSRSGRPHGLRARTIPISSPAACSSASAWCARSRSIRKSC